MNDLSQCVASPESIVQSLWFSCSLLLSLERWSQQTNWDAFGNYHKQNKGAGCHPKSHLSCVCLSIVFFFQNSAEIEKFSCGQHMHFEPAHKVRLLEQYRFQISIKQGWRLPVHSYIHHVWELLAELPAFLPREKIWNMNSLLFLKKNKWYAKTLQNYANYVVTHVRLTVPERLEIAKRFLAPGRQYH